MPNNIPDKIDFSYINEVRVRRLLERAESDRVNNNNIDAAIHEVNALEKNLYHGYYMLGAAPVIIIALVFNKKNKEEILSFDFLEAFLLVVLSSLIALRKKMHLPLMNILKQLNAYQAYLYNEKMFLLMKMEQVDAENENVADSTIVKLKDCLRSASKCFKQAQMFSKDVGYFSYDKLMLHVAAQMSDCRFNNATTGLSETVRSILNANVDPNCILPSELGTTKTIIVYYALVNNWDAVTELLGLPNLDIRTCPQEGKNQGQSVFSLCAINNRWDIFERLLGNYNPDINLRMNGEYKACDRECKGKTVIWVAARASKSQIVRALINRGAVIDRECLKKLLTRCDISVIEFGIQKGRFSKRQAIDIFNDCDFAALLLNVIVELDFWEQLKLAVNDSKMSDKDAVSICSTFNNEFGDARYANLSRLISLNEAKKRIVSRLQQEVIGNQIVRTLLKYNTDIIKAFMNLDSNKLQNMLDPISSFPAIIDPVYIKVPDSTTHTLYERSNITKWINKQYAKDQAAGYILQSTTDHPETRSKIDINNLTDLSAEEKAEIIIQVEKLLNELQNESRSRNTVKNTHT